MEHEELRSQQAQQLKLLREILRHVLLFAIRLFLTLVLARLQSCIASLMPLLAMACCSKALLNYLAEHVAHTYIQTVNM